MVIVIISLIIIVAVVAFIGARTTNTRQSRKWPKQKEAILNLFSQKGEVNNKDVRQALGVSDATVRRLMDKLEEEGLVEQIGSDGRNVAYKRK